jgi:hypothetical protein
VHLILWNYLKKRFVSLHRLGETIRTPSALPKPTQVGFCILALEDISNELVVYPNPMQNRLQIDLPKQMQGSKVVAITDLSGKILYKHTYNQENQLEIAVDKLPKGMYLLEVKNEYYKAVRKLMK